MRDVLTGLDFRAWHVSCVIRMSGDTADLKAPKEAET